MMFQDAVAINEFQLGLFSKVAVDIPEERLFVPGQGHGHPPVWILGHLTITAELGLRLLGGTITHVRWLKQFGPGSSDQVPDDGSLTKAQLIDGVVTSYRQLREMALATDSRVMAEPHGAEILKGSPIQTKGQLVLHLLTSHFALHSSQLSSCRRAEGHAALF